MRGFTLVVFAVFFNLPEETQKLQRPTQRCLKRRRFGETKKNIKKRHFEIFFFFFPPFIYALREL
jgi:transposase